MKKYIALLSLTLMFSSCGEDFLTVTTPNAIGVNDFPATANDLESVMVGAYANMHAYGLYGHCILAKGFQCWDHTQDMAWQGTQTWIQLCQNDAQASDLFLSQIWKDAYKGIQRTNNVLEILEAYKAGTSSIKVTIAANALTEYEAQAKFLRAWYYYNLITIWGEKFIISGAGRDAKGVPIFKNVAASLADASVPRSTVGEVWDFIIQDLKEAETLLASTNRTAWTGADRYKINVWGVRGFLGKVYAVTDDWTNAKTYLKNVIDNSGKSLVSFSTYSNMFNAFPESNEFNTESLIEIPMTTSNTDNSNNDLSTGSWHGMIQAPSVNITATGVPATGGWSNVFPHQANLRRFGWAQAHYFPPGVTSTNRSGVRANYEAESNAIRLAKSVDPRLWVSFLQPYVDKIGTGTTLGTALEYVGHAADGVPAQMPAWSFKKFEYLQGRQSAVRNFGANFYLLRLAEVYLLYAESLVETGGSSAEALEYINKVHRRAYDLPINTPSVRDYASLTAPTLAGDSNYGNNPLRYERYVEFFGEGMKWIDTRRWQDGAVEAAYYGAVRGGIINWKDSDYAQPIPTIEIENNAAIDFDVQNEGY